LRRLTDVAPNGRREHLKFTMSAGVTVEADRHSATSRKRRVDTMHRPS